MGIFPLTNPPSTQTASVNMISSKIHATSDKGKLIVDSTSSSHLEETYHVIKSIDDPTFNDHILVPSDPYHLPYWLDPPPYLDYLLQTLPLDESIMEVMSLQEIPLKYHHHRSYFLSGYHMAEYHF